jgi:hypothetical protein
VVVSSCSVSETRAITDLPPVHELSLGAPNLPWPLRTLWDSINVLIEGEGGWRWRCLRPKIVPSNNDERGCNSF